MQNYDLSKLNPEQLAAVTHGDGPLLVLAGAGSGKTRALTHRIAHLVRERDIYPWQILALTFTNKAAKEMRERVANLLSDAEAQKAWILTFHSFCVRVLSQDGDRLGYEKTFTIFDDTDQQSLIGRIVRDLGLNDKVYGKRMLGSAFSDAKNKSDDPAAFLVGSGQPWQVREAFNLYQKRLRESNSMDFDDLLLNTLQLLREYPEVLEKYQSRFAYILVDEYQDTNGVQYRILELLAKQRRNVCVVGDDDQSIYGWRGADIRNILEFERDFPGAKVIRLERNYRSTTAILNAANAVIQHNAGRKGKTLHAEKRGGESISLHEADDERAEAMYVCDNIVRGVRAGRRYSDFAILYRTHAQSRVLEMYLQGYNIPYRVYGGISFFSRAEVKDILAYMRLLLNPNDSEAFLRIVNTPRRGIGSAALGELSANAARRELPLMACVLQPEGLSPAATRKFTAFATLVQETFMAFATKPLSVAVSELLDSIHYDAYLREDEKERYEARAEVVQEFLGYIQEFEAGYEAGDPAVLGDFLSNVALFSAADTSDAERDSMRMMTLHAAKGLEFPTVFLCGLEDGLFPSSRSQFDPEKLEEERRLCYVGVTRAMDKLHLTFAKRRMLYGQIQESLPSRFLREMEGTIPPLYTPVRPRPDFYAKPAVPRADITDKPASIPKPAAKDILYAIGDKVRHNVFGQGMVAAIEGSAKMQVLLIQFANGQTKKFAGAYAPIEKI
ncbi:MAG: UvrD-helicase domain-containing protein [Clostridiales bacterium]|nr:UvrD-helicase domain-containing protein [Clostridiales bacterium]